jgi:hypothetical protein
MCYNAVFANCTPLLFVQAQRMWRFCVSRKCQPAYWLWWQVSLKRGACGLGLLSRGLKPAWGRNAVWVSGYRQSFYPLPSSPPPPWELCNVSITHWLENNSGSVAIISFGRIKPPWKNLTENKFQNLSICQSTDYYMLVTQIIMLKGS